MALLVSGCAGYQYHTDGMKLAAEGRRDAALPLLRLATEADPGNGEYRIDLLRETSQYVGDLLARAGQARRDNQPELAADLYAKVLRVEPANDRARRGLAAIDTDVRDTRLLGEADALLRDGHVDAARAKIDAVLANDPGSGAAHALLVQATDAADKQREAKAAAAAARSVMGKPVTLQFRDANLRMVFEALSRTTGLNVILDRDVRADLKTTIFVKDAAVEDTVDLILLQNQLEKRTLNANTLFVYPATAAKQKEYQDLQVRTFHIANADAKYLQSLLKGVLKIKEVSVDDRSGMLVVRDTPEAIAVAAKLIAAHDVPEPEVMLEIQVLEISHDRLSDLGIQFPDSVTLSTPVDANGNLTLSDLRHLRGGQTLVSPNPLALTLNFKLQDTDANLLASPRIRARNKEKARILIGDRVPIITNSVTPVASGSSVVTGSVSYQDVGLKLEFEPDIYTDDEVGIKISLEVSTIAKEISGPNGSLAYQIGTRNAQTAVRLRDGETQILGGLIQSNEQNTASKIPGLGHLPVLGRLFGNNSGSGNKTEIVLSITPHIVRPPAVLDASVREVYSGTESSVRERPLELDPVGAVRMPASAGTGAAPAQAPVVAPPRPPLPGSAPAAAAPSAPAAPAATGAATIAPPAPTAPAGTPAAPPGTEAYMRRLMPFMNGRRNVPAAPPPPPAASQADAGPAPAPEPGT
ncbi:MAG: secretin N-terminal domain-containing protein [Burkholderiaceae bacterium]